MGLRILQNLGHKQDDAAPAPEQMAERFLMMLAEGAAQNMPAYDSALQEKLIATIHAMAMQMPDRLSAQEKEAKIQEILHEFGVYRYDMEETLHERQREWQSLSGILLRSLLTSLGFPNTDPDVAKLLKRIGKLSTAEELQSFQSDLTTFLLPNGGLNRSDPRIDRNLTDNSQQNLNATGLYGGGSAVEYVRQIMSQGANGFIVLVRLSALEIIEQRFGMETVEDALMAVSNYLTSSLHREDRTYHWSDSMLLIVIQGRTNEKILTAELQRIAMNNREISLTINGHTIMVRVPLDFEITPIRALQAAEDIYKLTINKKEAW